MKSEQAVVDTSVIILVTFVGRNEDDDDRKRRQRAERVLADLIRNRVKLVIPTPVIAELCRNGKGSRQIAALVQQLKRSVKTCALSGDAADIAGQMRKTALEKRALGSERGAISYDALIAATAHHIGAKWLITVNPRDYATCFAAVGSTVQVVNTDALPGSGQLDLFLDSAASKTAPDGASLTPTELPGSQPVAAAQAASILKQPS